MRNTALCEQALAIDPNNVLALTVLGIKPFMQAGLGISGDPKGDIKRADELEFKALALDPDYAVASRDEGQHPSDAGAHRGSRRRTRARARPGPIHADAVAKLGVDYLYLGQSDKSLEYFDKAIWASPSDPALLYWYGIKAWANFGLKKL